MSRHQLHPGLITAGRNGQGGAVISGPWPSYKQFRDLRESERLKMYRHAKLNRAALEAAGFAMAEPYDDFIRRVCEELDI